MPPRQGRRGIITYRLQLSLKDKAFKGIETRAFKDDLCALEGAQALMSEIVVEIWDGERLVSRVAADGSRANLSMKPAPP